MQQLQSQYPYRTIRINTMGSAQNKKSTKVKKNSKSKKNQNKNYHEIDELEKYNLRKEQKNCHANKPSPFKIKKIGNKNAKKLLTLIGFTIQSADKAIKFIPQSNLLQAKFLAKLYYSDRQNLLNWINSLTTSKDKNLDFINWSQSQNIEEKLKNFQQNIRKNQNKYNQSTTNPTNFQQISEIYKTLSSGNNVLQTDKFNRYTFNDQQIKKQLNYLKLEVERLKQMRTKYNLKNIKHQPHQIHLQKLQTCQKCQDNLLSRCCFCSNKAYYTVKPVEKYKYQEYERKQTREKKRSHSNKCESSIQTHEFIKNRPQLGCSQLKNLGKINNMLIEQSLQRLQENLMFENRIKTQLIIKLNEIISRISSDQNLICKIQNYVSLILSSIKNDQNSESIRIKQQNQAKIRQLQQIIFNSSQDNLALKNKNTQNQVKTSFSIQDQLKKFINQNIKALGQSSQETNQLQILRSIWQKYQQFDRLLKQKQQKYQVLQQKLKNNQANQKLNSEIKILTKQKQNLNNDKIRLQKELSVKANNFGSFLSILKNILINWGKCQQQLYKNLQSQNLTLETKTILIVQEIQKIINQNKKYQFQIQNKTKSKNEKLSKLSNKDPLKSYETIDGKHQKRRIDSVKYSNQLNNGSFEMSESSYQNDYLESLKQQLVAKDEALIQLSQMMEEKDNQNENLKIHLKRKEQALQIMQAELNQTASTKRQIQQILEEKNYLSQSQIKSMNQQMLQKKYMICELQANLQQLDQQLSKQKLNKQKLCQIVDELSFRITKQQQDRWNLLDFIKKLQEKQKDHQDLIFQKNKDVQQLQSQLIKAQRFNANLIQQHKIQLNNRQDKIKNQQMLQRQIQSILNLQEQNQELKEINQNYMQNLLDFRNQIQILKTQINKLKTQANSTKQQNIIIEDNNQKSSIYQCNKQIQNTQNTQQHNGNIQVHHTVDSIPQQKQNTKQKLESQTNIQSIQKQKKTNIQSIQKQEKANIQSIQKKKDIIIQIQPNQALKTIEYNQSLQSKIPEIKINDNQIYQDADQQQMQKSQPLLLKNDLEQTHFNYPIEDSIEIGINRQIQKSEKENECSSLQQNQNDSLAYVDKKQQKSLQQQNNQSAQDKKLLYQDQELLYQDQELLYQDQELLQQNKIGRVVTQVQEIKKELQMKNIQNEKLKEELKLLTNKFNHNIDYLNSIIDHLSENQQQNQKPLYKNIQSQDEIDLVIQLRTQIANQKQINAKSLNIITQFSEMLQSEILPSLEELTILKQIVYNKENSQEFEVHSNSQKLNQIQDQMNQILQKDKNKIQKLTINLKLLQMKIQPQMFEQIKIQPQMFEHSKNIQYIKQSQIQEKSEIQKLNYIKNNQQTDQNTQCNQNQMLQSLFTQVYQRVQVLTLKLQQKRQQCEQLQKICAEKQNQIQKLKQNKLQQKNSRQIGYFTQPLNQSANDRQSDQVLGSMLKHHREQILSLHQQLRQNQKLTFSIVNNSTHNIKQNNTKNYDQSLKLKENNNSENIHYNQVYQSEFDMQKQIIKKQANDLRFILQNRQLAFNNIITQKDQEIQQLKTNMCQILKNIKKENLKVARSDSKESGQSRRSFKDKVYQQELKELKILQLQTIIKNITAQHKQLIDKFDQTNAQIQHLKIILDQKSIESQIVIQKYKLQNVKGSQIINRKIENKSSRKQVHQKTDENQLNKTVMSQGTAHKQKAKKTNLIQNQKLLNQSIQSHKKQLLTEKIKDESKQQDIIMNKKQFSQQIKKRSARSLSPIHQNFKIENIVPQFFGKSQK